MEGSLRGGFGRQVSLLLGRGKISGFPFSLPLFSFCFVSLAEARLILPSLPPSLLPTRRLDDVCHLPPSSPSPTFTAEDDL